MTVISVRYFDNYLEGNESLDPVLFEDSSEGIKRAIQFCEDSIPKLDENTRHVYYRDCDYSMSEESKKILYDYMIRGESLWINSESIKEHFPVGYFFEIRRVKVQ